MLRVSVTWRVKSWSDPAPGELISYRSLRRTQAVCQRQHGPQTRTAESATTVAVEHFLHQGSSVAHHGGDVHLQQDDHPPHGSKQ